ncbi:MAG TPA: class A beta-lactamase-related serine hydrolase [Flavobacterium sp.]|uniref:serine hydrolase n=1 Tax=Flavobacterium sp. TaxID=239 RepID=UPI002BDA3A87|nr:serine hydrolase [Flavobacterium sp.]HNP32478.1 class A beta-lactamase-related serine hydrolase [Flavobacterium sp.]
MNLKNKNYSFLQMLLFSLFAVLTTYGVTSFLEAKKFNKQISSISGTPICKYDVKRLNGLKYIKPLMFVDEECESDNLAGTKQQLADIINRYKASGDVASASVYLRDYVNSDWVGVNDDEKYQPASLLKVPVLITILKMNEENPGFLNKVVLYDKPVDAKKDIIYAEKSIKVGHKYTIKELLDYMIKYSDNNATILLESNMKPETFKKLFTDFGLETPNEYDNQYLVTVKQYSFFMRAIYNAAYLTINDSEYAAELLTQCQFRDGITKGLPANTVVAHKFGESGNPAEKQLHESAIVYLDNRTYLLTIMTKGKDNKKLSQLIGEISQAVYTEMSSNYVAGI